MEKKEFLTLDKVEAYKRAFKLSNAVWAIVSKWDKFERWTIGIQLTKSADSISANIAEGFGRYYKKEKIQFYRYSFGSMEETKDWLRKAFVRNIISEEEKDNLASQLSELPKLINYLIKYTNEKLKY